MEMTQKRICSTDPLVYLYVVKVLKLLRRLKQLSASVAEPKKLITYAVACTNRLSSSQCLFTRGEICLFR